MSQTVDACRESSQHRCREKTQEENGSAADMEDRFKKAGHTRSLESPAGKPVFALALQLTGSYRVAILSLLIFFLAGLSVLSRTDVKQGEHDVLKSA